MCNILYPVFCVQYFVRSIIYAVFVHYSVCSFHGSVFCVQYFLCTQVRNNNKSFSPVFCSLSKEGVCVKLQQKTAAMFCIIEQMQKHFAFHIINSSGNKNKTFKVNVLHDFIFIHVAWVGESGKLCVCPCKHEYYLQLRSQIYSEMA